MSMGLTPQKRRPDRAPLLIAVALVLIAAVIIWDASRINAVGGYSPVGPSTVPMIIGFGMIGLAIWTVFDCLKGKFPTRERQEFSPVAWVVAGLVIQMLLLNHAGFSIATGVMFAFTARAFGKTQLWKSIPVGIGLSFLVYVLFAKLLQLSIPAGPLERLFF